MVSRASGRHDQTQLIERRGALDFVERGENVLLRRPSGAGKTMLAKNFGHAALLAGKTVRFTTLAAALADLLQQQSLPAFERRLKRYTQPALLILDELGCRSNACVCAEGLFGREDRDGREGVRQRWAVEVLPDGRFRGCGGTATHGGSPRLFTLHLRSWSSEPARPGS